MQPRNQKTETQNGSYEIEKIFKGKYVLLSTKVDIHAVIFLFTVYRCKNWTVMKAYRKKYLFIQNVGLGEQLYEHEHPWKQISELDRREKESLGMTVVGIVEGSRKREKLKYAGLAQ